MAPTGQQGAASMRRLFGYLARAFSLRSTILGGVLALVVWIGTGILDTAGKVLFISELGWTKEDYSYLIGGWAVVCAALGAVGGGFLADRVGPKRLAAVGIILLGCIWTVFGLMPEVWDDRIFVNIILIGGSLLSGMISVSLFALFMGMSWPRVAATQFTAYMALMNLSTVLGYRVAGWLEGRMEWTSFYFLGGILQVVAVLVLLAIAPHQSRRALGERGDEEV